MLLIFSSLLQKSYGPWAWPIAKNWKLVAAQCPAVGDFPPVVASDRVPLSIDFASIIPTGDALASSGASASIGVYSGADPNAANLAWGVPAVAGSIVTQWVGPGWVPGVIYRVTLTVETGEGATLTLYGHIECKALN